MRNTILTIVALAVVSSTATSQWQRVNGYTCFDHGHSAGNVWDPRNIDTTPTFAVMQIFPNHPQFNSAHIEDFDSKGIVTDVGVMFQADNPMLNLNNIIGWRVSVWSSPGDAANSGFDLSGNTIATTFVPNSQVTYKQQFGTQHPDNAFSAEMAVNLTTGTGKMYFGMAPEFDIAGNGQTYILHHTGTYSGVHVPGGGFNSWAVNPLNGFGVGSLIPIGTNAAYGINSVPVPEPGLMAALGLGLAAIARRRRGTM